MIVVMWVRITKFIWNIYYILIYLNYSSESIFMRVQVVILMIVF